MTENIPAQIDTTTESVKEELVSHKEALDHVRKEVTLLLKDPLLSDLPVDFTKQDILSRLALERGHAFTVIVRRETEEGHQHIPIIVNKTTRICTLKRQIEREFARKIQEDGGSSKLSWKYFWRTYWLAHNNEKLIDVEKQLQEYNISKGAELYFMKRLRRK